MKLKRIFLNSSPWNFSQYSKRFWDFWILLYLALSISILPNSGNRCKIDFYECKPRLYSQIFPNSLQSWVIGIFEVPLVSYFVRLKGYYFKQSMFVWETKRSNLRFSRRRNTHIYKTILSIFKCWKYIFQT